MKGGEFVVKNLEPGDYAMHIAPADELEIVFPGEAPEIPSTAGGGKAGAPPKKFYGSRWYPDVPGIEMASRIHLAEGENRRLDISLQSHSAYTLSGTIRAPREFERTPVSVALRSEHVLAPLTRQMAQPGAFRIENLTPGTYRFAVTAGKAPNQVAADFAVEITHDLANFKVELVPEAGVAGEIRMAQDGVELPAGTGIFFMVPTSGWVALVKGGGLLVGGDMPVSGAPIRAGTFRQDSIRPGEYWPTLLGVPQGYALAQTVFEGASARNSALKLSAPDTPVTFILTSRPGAVTGTVRDEKLNSVRGAQVLLLPDPLPDLAGPAAIRMEESGEDGGFAFRDIAPGRYRAVVLRAPDGSDGSDVGQLRELAARAEGFEVRAAQSANISLKR
jgi:hypothetical protein